MHTLEPFFNWRDFYKAEEDARSPFHGREYNEFEFTDHIYDHAIHPQWDNFGSSTLFMKLLFADYVGGTAVIEFIGEWNDLLYNDIMILKRDIIEHLMYEGINKFIIVGENVLNFHFSEEDYYEEWLEELDEGWIIGVNFQEHVLLEMQSCNIDSYINFGGQLQDLNWRTFTPTNLCEFVGRMMERRLEI